MHRIDRMLSSYLNTISYNSTASNKTSLKLANAKKVT